MKINIIGYALILLVVVICIKIYMESDMYNLKCIISNVDGNTYCVREKENMDKAANILAETNKRLKKLVNHCNEKYKDRENVNRLYKGFNPDKIYETLPTSKYTAYSQNKGEKLAFCLNKEKDNKELIDINTLVFVAIHELSHIASKSVGHTDEFWGNFRFLLIEAKDIGIYKPEDYNEQSKRYCGTDITDNPYYDEKIKSPLLA